MSILTVFAKVVYFLLISFSGAICVNTYRRRWQLTRRGHPVPDMLYRLTGGWRRLLMYLPGQWYFLRNLKTGDLSGIQHFFLFWGSVLFSTSYLLIIFFGDFLGLTDAIRGWPFIEILLYAGDIAGVLLLVGLTWGLLRRTILRPRRLEPDFEVVTFVIICFAAYILINSYFILEGIRLNLQIISWAGPVSSFLADLTGKGFTLEGQKILFEVCWYLQAVFTSCFMVYIPFSNHQHPFFAPLTIYQGPHLLPGRLNPVPLDTTYKGLGNAQDLNQRQLTELYACTQCGRCQEICPAAKTGTPLSPKLIVQDLKNDMDYLGRICAPWKGRVGDKGEKNREMGGVISEESLWSCTACMACVDVCPAYISPLDKIIDLRRDRVMIRTQIFDEVGNLFKDVETYGDTFGKGKAYREDWALGKDFKVAVAGDPIKTLFWVGCQGTFNDRIKSISVTFADFMTRFDPDFAIMGKNEFCCGEPIRRLGNELLYQQLARENIARLKQLQFDRIVTACPHCYNVLKNEYPQLGGLFNVLHHTEMLDEWIQQGRLATKHAVHSRVVYHDPCYLARANSIEDAPRRILKATPELELCEPQQTGKQTFCCGGGGGKMWIRETGSERINSKRVEMLSESEPDLIATSCPYCLVMLEDGISSNGQKSLQCRDIVEIINNEI